MSDDATDVPRPPVLSVPPSGPITAHAFRLRPGESLANSLGENVEVIFGRTPADQCAAAVVLTAVGSLRDVTLRLANASRMDPAAEMEEVKEKETQRGGGDVFGDLAVDPNVNGEILAESGGNDVRRWRRRFEIVSLVGTFSRDGGRHLHISLSDSTGRTIGGHLIDGAVFTTVEVVVGAIAGVEFRRAMDKETGYRELMPMQLLDDDLSRGKTRWKDLAGITLLAAAAGALTAALMARAKR
uniref:PPC domain-containing protein n=1 Tax=Trieres chinensis TaxID=1514140 RepID=A0A7S2A1K6_TRICV|mmetsp:Transcript_37941/g.77444  ORF Transcript_37941/g.77444 Transcript_37941/m.77444 type:complete len:242 (+) Transcript_37941:40-765(+)|eukprot:CAMPEP_0183297160 /NCGR_PEP_ID=MMETSP0160_2-20130417/4525_1 /TAXON_ID=2839 ORGANISM="Odontella Sinensis, Strain Grunow 1884" /NCGR_SAMPLE_ID=MMETSP0160_2 /ASSEMBLY_ACC=CAM_ASM_000250 /LENGTH=241 /DNA_ID=CAMNT_0025458923 /DNA_START=10 /DNA_END=735 /DNA_ORIENTATION=-